MQEFIYDSIRRNSSLCTCNKQKYIHQYEYNFTLINQLQYTMNIQLWNNRSSIFNKQARGACLIKNEFFQISKAVIINIGRFLISIFIFCCHLFNLFWHFQSFSIIWFNLFISLRTFKLTIPSNLNKFYIFFHLKLLLLVFFHFTSFKPLSRYSRAWQ